MSVNKATADASPLIERCADECLDRGWRLAWLMLRHREDAADAVQQAFVVALTKRDRVPADNPWPWLAAVIARECQYIRRKRSRATTNLGTVEPSMSIADKSAAQPHSDLERLEQQEQVARALDELPVEERDALLLAKLGGLTYAEVAAALNVPLGTINHRISRAMTTLRRRLRDDDEPEVVAALAVLPIATPPIDLREALAARSLMAGAMSAGAAFIGGVAMKKAGLLLLALVVLLLASAGIVALLVNPAGDTATPRTAALTNTGKAEGEDTKRPAPSKNVPDAAEDKPVSGQPNEPPATPASEANATATPLRVLIATDPAGEPASLNFIVDWRISEDEPWTTQHVTTGADGRAQLEAPVEAMLRVNIEESDWVLGWRNVLLKPGESDASIEVYRVKPLRIRVTYADGKPYVGPLTIKAGRLWQASVQMQEQARGTTVAPVGWPNLAERATLYFHEFVEFAGLPSGVEITFETIPSRSGYSVATQTVKLSEDSTDELVEVVIPEGVAPNTPGKIVLTLEEGVKLEQRPVLFKVLPTGAWQTSVWNSRDFPVSGKVWPARYVLFILGTQAWQSEEFELAAGETKELRPHLSSSGSVSARVVNEQGDPVRGAVLAFDTEDRPHSVRFSDEVPTVAANGEAISGADGKVTLATLPAGAFRFQVYFPGCQPWTGFATLVAGQDFDMGDIRLEVAKGRVEAQLPDWDFKVRKLTWTLTDRNGHTFRHGNVESSALVIEGLPVGRTYALRVSISVSNGARAFWYTKPFELTHAVATQKLDGSDKKWPSDLD